MMNKLYALVLLSVFSFSAFAQWQKLNPSINKNNQGVHFLSADTGYVVSEQKIFKTVDGGQNWINYPIPSGMSTLFFTNTNIGYIAGGDVYKTIDGGQAWNQVLMADISSLHFINDSIGFGSEWGYKIYKTTDAGLTWNYAMSSGMTHYYSKIHFPPSSNTGYTVGAINGAGGPVGVVAKTTNLGATWQHTFSNPPNIKNGFYGMAVFFIDSLRGWVGGGRSAGCSLCNQLLVYTDNGGQSWDTLSTVFPYEISDIFFTNHDTGIVTDLYGQIFATYNAGLTWVNEYTPTAANNLFDVFCIENVCYAVGDSGLILKKNLLNSFKERNRKDDFNIYPNPGNGLFTIELPSTSSSFISVYNSLGLCVFKESQQIITGKYSLDMKSFPDGVYFVEVKSNATVVTKKTILYR